MSIWLILALIAFIVINFFWSKSIYNQSVRFYASKEVNDGHPIKDIHERYSVFRRNDKLSFIRIFLGMTFLFWWRMAIAIVLALIYNSSLRYI